MKKVIVGTAFNIGEVMVIFQVNGKGIPNHLKLISMLDDAIFNMPPTDTGVQYSLESVILAYEIKNDKREIENEHFRRKISWRKSKSQALLFLEGPLHFLFPFRAVFPNLTKFKPP